MGEKHQRSRFSFISCLVRVVSCLEESPPVLARSCMVSFHLRVSSYRSSHSPEAARGVDTGHNRGENAEGVCLP